VDGGQPLVLQLLCKQANRLAHAVVTRQMYLGVLRGQMVPGVLALSTPDVACNGAATVGLPRTTYHITAPWMAACGR
jgi:hypothetical protein